VAGRSGQAVQPVQRHQHGTEPPARPIRELSTQRPVVTAGTGEELGHPVPELVALGGGSRGIEREPVVIGHGALHTRSRRSHPAVARMRWVASLNRGSVPPPGDGSPSHSVRPVLVGWIRVPVPGLAMPNSTRSEAMITPAWHTATTLRPSYSRASRASISRTRS